MSGESIAGYPGAALEASWDTRLGIHVGETHGGAQRLRQSGPNPWCGPDVGDAPFVGGAVTRCPTGALSDPAGDEGPAAAPADENTVVASNDGLLGARGELRIAGPPVQLPGVPTPGAPWGCGGSSNTPRCGATHAEIWCTAR